MTPKFLLLFFFCSLTAFSQNIAGTWYGEIDLGVMKLPMVLHIDQTESGYTATMDSPKQGATGIPVPKTTVRQDSLFLDMSNLMAKFSGEILTTSQRIKGQFSQRGMSFPLVFTRKKPTPPKRPQEPKKPYPYHSEDVSFHNDLQDITLAGTLTYPKTGADFPAVILITGSGPENRNEELMGHKPFLVIADYLTRHGIAVLRYDDRGVAESGGTYKGATLLDFATDAAAAFKYLQTRSEIDSDKIGLMGHSGGGAIAPLVASKNGHVAFVIMLAGPGVKGGQVLLKQQELIGKASGLSKDYIALNKSINRKAYQIITKINDSTKLRNKLQTYFTSAIEQSPEWNLARKQGVTDEQYVHKVVESYLNPWLRQFIAYNPAPTLKQVDCPVLALNGGNDLQVSAEQNLPAVKKALIAGGNEEVTVKELKGLNHLFQESKTGLPAEYGKIQQTFSPKALTLITTWIYNQF